MLLWPNTRQLSYPFGRAAAINWAHPVAQNLTRAHGFVGVATTGGGRSMVDLTTGSIGAVFAGTPVSTVNSFIGPALFLGASGSIQFSGKTSFADTQVTVGAIVYFTTSNGNVPIFAAGVNNPSAGMELITDAGGTWDLAAGFVAAYSSSITAATQSPYFVVASAHKGASIINYYVRRLDTGVIKTGVVASAIAPQPTGTSYTVGQETGGPVNACQIAAVVYSPTFLSMQQLQAWGDDPWAFWYPYPLPMKVGITTATFKAAWALNRNFINQGGVAT